ncbi:winged helix-turn-helix domain-containing protein [Proteiniphilum sp. UBA5310]|jgi:DNA-binding transcriptional regulator YhcF (GntR family)|uniref:winged helix-turn-helix domain-containing protein n=1 Tax=Proteiniphilum sp. UBA5310 TaxID=1947275 RepID=UPI00257F0B9D|nr:winged helix-turn-helix domain-containing protein [Proteiniphilum sp. UBA5310]
MELKFDHKATKVQQLTDYIQGAIFEKELQVGDKLPSINYLSRKYCVSRDTVFKAFLKLKEIGLIDSIQGKSYFVSRQSTNTLLLLDEYTPFKEALFNSLVNKLPLTYKVDLWFHQYNKSLFDTIINESYGRYSKYIVMNYDNEKFSNTLEKIDKNRLLLIDFGNFDKDGYSYVCQDFDEQFYNALSSVKKELSKYNKLVYILNKKHKHPQSSKIFFSKFCKDYGFEYEIWDNAVKELQQSCCYIIIKQIDVVDVIKQSKHKNMEMGKDFGLIAYNENPFYEIIGNGVPCISIDFNLLGDLAGNFVLNGEKIKQYLPTIVYRKDSI